jgi:hypothetical protein
MSEIPVYFDLTIQHAGMRPEKLILATRAAGDSTDPTLSLEEAAHVASKVLGRVVEPADVVHLATREGDLSIETTAEIFGPYLVWRSDQG